MGNSAQTLTIAELVEQARRRFDRVQPHRLADEMADGALVVDIRPLEQRQRDGELPGAVVICRNVLEWRLDPASDSRLDLATDHDLRVVVVCNEGYSSSLAVASLLDLGVMRATDLVGGFQAWKAWSDLVPPGRSTGGPRWSFGSTP